MARNLIVNGVTYKYPDQGENPDWGQNASDWAEAVTNIISTLSGSDDVQRTSFTIQNGVLTPTNVTGLAFSTGTVRSCFIDYSVYRLAEDSVNGTTELKEQGTFQAIYSGETGTWDFTQEFSGDAGVTFSISNSGQFQYTSTAVPADTTYSSTMIFQGKGYSQ